MAKKPPYRVGYKKPPQHTQFKPGQSGNSRGRPKKKEEDLSVEQVLRKDLSGSITLHDRKTGKSQKMRRFDAAIKQLSTMAILGEIKAMTLLFKIMGQQKLNSREASIFIEAFRERYVESEVADARDIDVDPEDAGNDDQT